MTRLTTKTMFASAMLFFLLFTANTITASPVLRHKRDATEGCADLPVVRRSLLMTTSASRLLTAIRPSFCSLLCSFFFLRQSTDGTCGFNGYRCPQGSCCSAWGFCSSGADAGTHDLWCASQHGCQRQFGKCWGTADLQCGKKLGGECSASGPECATGCCVDGHCEHTHICFPPGVIGSSCSASNGKECRSGCCFNGACAETSKCFGNGNPAARPFKVADTPVTCIANYVSNLIYTNPYNTTIYLSGHLIGGGGGGSSVNGAGGGGGSTSVNVTNPATGQTTRHYGPGGNGGHTGPDYTGNNDLNGYNGDGGHATEFSGLAVPPGATVRVFVGGGGGGANGQWQHGGNPYAGGGGGAGGYGGGGGSSGHHADNNGGVGAETNKGGGEPGINDKKSDATSGSGSNGGDGGADYWGEQGFGGQGMNGGSRGNMGNYPGGGGGGWGSGGGRGTSNSCGGANHWSTNCGSNGGSNGGNSQDGYAKGARSFAVPTALALPAGAGAGGQGILVYEMSCTGCDNSITYGGNAGYAVLQYTSPDGTCLLPKQA